MVIKSTQVESAELSRQAPPTAEPASEQITVLCHHCSAALVMRRSSAVTSGNCPTCGTFLEVKSELTGGLVDVPSRRFEGVSPSSTGRAALFDSAEEGAWRERERKRKQKARIAKGIEKKAEWLIDTLLGRELRVFLACVGVALGVGLVCFSIFAR